MEIVSKVMYISVFLIVCPISALIYDPRFDIIRDSWIERIFKFHLLKINLIKLKAQESKTGHKNIILRILVTWYFMIYFSIYLGIIGILFGILFMIIY